MAKKITLTDIAAMLSKQGEILLKHGKEIRDLTTTLEKGFAAVANDIADLKVELKGNIAHVQDQVNSIEAELKYGRYETRLGNLEQKVFGAPRR